MSAFRPAQKRQLKARVALAGPTGSGKTWTALAWASVLGKTVALIDTERRSAELYADHYQFDVAIFDPPYEPARLEAMLREGAASYDVVIVDSLSHFWQGEGGVLDIVDGAAQRAHGNSFAGWKVGTPAYRSLVDTMVGLDCHVIATMRSKMEYVLETDSRGKQVPRKIGMAPVMRDGIEYEFTLLGDLDLEHRMVISKSRCDVLADQVIQPHHEREAAEVFARWLDDGLVLASAEDRERIKQAFDVVTDSARRGELKQEFVGVMGPLDQLPAERVAEADAWLERLLMDEPPTLDGMAS